MFEWYQGSANKMDISEFLRWQFGVELILPHSRVQNLFVMVSTCLIYFGKIRYYKVLKNVLFFFLDLPLKFVPFIPLTLASLLMTCQNITHAQNKGSIGQAVVSSGFILSKVLPKNILALSWPCCLVSKSIFFGYSVFTALGSKISC